MKRVALLVQVVVAVGLTVLWLRWNPLSGECPDGVDCAPGFDPFTQTRREPVASTSESPEDWPLQVELGRCALAKLGSESRSGREVECIYQPGDELRLWVAHRRIDRVQVSIDGAPISSSVFAIQEEPGRGLRVTLEEETARQLSVQVPGEEPWTTPVRAMTRLTDRERAELARLDARAIRLEAHMALGHLEMVPDLRRLVADMLDRGWLSRAVETVLAASYHLTYRGGRPELSQQLIDGLPSLRRYPWGRAAASIYLGHALREQGRLVDAARGYRIGGRYAVRMNDTGLELDALSMYASVLAELGYFEAAAHWGAQVLELARVHERLADRVDAMNTVGWSNLGLRQAGQAHDDPEPWFRQVLALFEREADIADDEVEPARLGLAKHALLDGEPGDAIAHLDRIELEHLTPDERVEAYDIRLQSLLAGATPDSAQIDEALQSLEEAAAVVVSPTLRWRAAVRRGTVRLRKGERSEARAAYEQAEALLDRLIPLAMLGVSGEARPAVHAEGTQRLVALLLEQGDEAGALCVARRAQARTGQLARLFGRLDPEAQAALRPKVAGYLRAKREYEALLRTDADRSVEDSERARREAEQRHRQLERYAAEILSVSDGSRGGPGCEKLTPRRLGELLLGLYPHLGDLLVLVQDDEGTTHRVLSNHDTLMRSDDARWLGTLLLSPLDERLARASRVRVMASGEAAVIDVHALPWRGEPLVASVPVVYGVEFPITRAPERASASALRALVVADPRARETKAEAETVERILVTEGWEVTRAASTTRAAHTLRELLASVQHFHYAGHAYYDRPGAPQRAMPNDAANDADNADVRVHRLWPPYPGGAAAEPSYIPLGGRERLDVQDILMMERVPQTVVLMGCATGVHDERTAYGGFSLATAFLGAGAEVVVASTRRVDGTEASLVGQGLHMRLRGGAMHEPGTWFKDGLGWAQSHGLLEASIADYRVFVP